jgi:hypothetical protein
MKHFLRTALIVAAIAAMASSVLAANGGEDPVIAADRALDAALARGRENC